MAKTTHCPICGKPAEQHYMPFCSARCADVDLGRWLTEQYRLPARGHDTVDPGPDDDAPPA